MQIDPQYESYGSLYHKIQKDSKDFHNAVGNLFDTMKQTNVEIQTEIDYLKSVSVELTLLIRTLKSPKGLNLKSRSNNLFTIQVYSSKNLQLLYE